MSNLSDIGNLMFLDINRINPGEGLETSEFLIIATAQTLNRLGGRNWVPVIVKEVGENRYEVIGNSFIYAVAEKAGLERVWCIIADKSEETAELTKVLSGEVTPKINLSTATRDEIQAALQYLIDKPNSELKSFKLLVATNHIEEAPSRQYWQTLEPITSLKCGITKGKKLDALKEVFYLTPQPMPVAEAATAPEVVVIKKTKAKTKTTSSGLRNLTVKELQTMAKERGITGYSKKSKAELIKLLN
jgi:hypothetical protein